ncbi:hypothetical protein FRC10_007575 [Ceratobasidium sp. 414]|nr:hypothetical protein FRC10_007575 [Ceratobasidium sp. 414]
MVCGLFAAALQWKLTLLIPPGPSVASDDSEDEAEHLQRSCQNETSELHLDILDLQEDRPETSDAIDNWIDVVMPGDSDEVVDVDGLDDGDDDFCRSSVVGGLFGATQANAIREHGPMGKEEAVGGQHICHAPTQQAGDLKKVTHGSLTGRNIQPNCSAQISPETRLQTPTHTEQQVAILHSHKSQPPHVLKAVFTITKVVLQSSGIWDTVEEENDDVCGDPFKESQNRKQATVTSNPSASVQRHLSPVVAALLNHNISSPSIEAACAMGKTLIKEKAGIIVDLDTDMVIDISDDSDQDITEPPKAYEAFQRPKSLGLGNFQTHGPESSHRDEEAWTISLHPVEPEMLQPLQNCICQWSVGYAWQDDNESNPIWAFHNDVLMGQEVMDQVSCYLAYQAVLSSGGVPKLLCLVPPSVFGALMRSSEFAQGPVQWMRHAGHQGAQRLQGLRDMVWTSNCTPARILLPVIDPRVIHSYMWYGDVQPQAEGPGFSCQLKYLDSLSAPSMSTFNQRLQEAKLVLSYLLPQLTVNTTGVHMKIPAYRQKPGSLDCGVFVCQAVSALSSFKDSALHQPLSVPVVRKRILDILGVCADKGLVKIGSGQKHAFHITLHSEPRLASPPWRAEQSVDTLPPIIIKKGLQDWVAPKYERSLSEPRGFHPSELVSVNWDTLFGPRAAACFTVPSLENTRKFLKKLDSNDDQLPPVMLSGVVPRLPSYLLEAVLLHDDPTPSHNFLPPGVHVVGGDDEARLQYPEDCAGVVRMGHMLSHLREGRERSYAILTGESSGEPLRLDWSRNTVDLELEHLAASLDIDSLSLTASKPQFIMPAALHAYPPRATTLTTDNGLSVDVNGKKTPLSHSTSPGHGVFIALQVELTLLPWFIVPNFTLLNMGINNQFRVNVFFPNLFKGTNAGGRYITMLTKEEFTKWWEQVFLIAFARARHSCAEALIDTWIRLNTELPKSYSAAEGHCLNGSRSFSGYKIMPQMLNLILGLAVDVVQQDVRLAMFQGFFYHIWGINLKAVAEAIPERSGGSTVLHVLQLFPIVDWSRQNPLDIVLDVGIEINVRRENLPLDVEDLTLLWKLDELKDLTAGSWRKPTIDAYVHSHVVGGINARPRTHIGGAFYKLQAYHKDKVLTYIHSDNSIGTGFSPQDGLLGSKAYHVQTSRRQEAWETGRGSYGVRIEWRCGLWGATEILKLDPELWKTRFLTAGAIRPDDMSSSRGMVKDLGIVSRAIAFGIASIPLHRFGPDMLRVTGDVTISRYPILKYVNRKNPAGARIKTATASHQTDEDTEAPAGDSETEQDTWGEDDQAWVERLINVTFASWLWTTLPEQDRVSNLAAPRYAGPLLLRNWGSIVDRVQYRERSRAGGFDRAIARFFPPDWVLPDTGRQWRSLGVAVLDQIQERIQTVGLTSQAEYSQRLRTALEGVLKHWEYLPGAQKRTVWIFEGSGKTKTYMICRNPNVRRL